MRVLGMFKKWAGKRPTATLVATETNCHFFLRQRSWAIGNGPSLYAHLPLLHPFIEAITPGAAPGPPVKTGARVCRFQGCKNRTAILK